MSYTSVISSRGLESVYCFGRDGQGRSLQGLKVFFSSMRARVVGLLLILALGVPVALPAADLVVPRDHETIVAAIAAAQAGDRVLIRGGVYSTSSGETFPIPLKDGVTVQGAGKYVTIVDGSGSGQPAFSLTGVTVTISPVIEGLQVRGGGGPAVDGGAFFFDSNFGAPVVLQDLLLRFNTADRGGAVWASDTSVTLKDCEIRDNTVSFFGGGVAVSGALGSVTVDASTITENEAVNGNGGGAAALNDGTLELLGAQIVSNHARYGGGLHVEGSLPATVDDEGNPTVIRENTASAGGGGFQAFSGSALYLDQVEIASNIAPKDPAFRVGGSYLVMDRCRVAYHDAEQEVAECLTSSLEITNTMVYRNSSLSGAILLLENSGGVVVHSNFVYNTIPAASLSGAIVINGAPVAPNPILRLNNNIIAFNTGVGVVERTFSSDPEFRNNLLYGNALGQYTDEIFFIYTTQSQLNNQMTNAPQITGGMRTGDPAFLRPGLDDFRLGEASDARDRALPLISPPGSAYDFDLVPRYSAKSGTAPDIGAFEITAPGVNGTVLFYPQGPNLTITDDVLVFQFNRPVRLNGALTPSDFYLPVAGDLLPGTVAAQVDPRNPCHLLVTLQGPYSLQIQGVYSDSNLTPGSPSGIDLKAGVGTLKVVDADFGTPVLPLGGDPTTNTTALDIAIMGGPAKTVAINPLFGATLTPDATSLLPESKLVVPGGALIYDATIRFRTPEYPRASSSAIMFELVSGSPVLKYNNPARLTIQYDPEEFEALGYAEEDLEIYRLTEIEYDVFEFVSLREISDYAQTQDFASHTLSTSLEEIIPPRAVLPNSEVYEGHLKSIYMVWPRTTQAGYADIEYVGPSPVPRSTVVHLAGPPSVIETAVSFPNHRYATDPFSAIRMSLRSANYSREVTGRSPRPWRRTPTGVIAVSARETSPGGLGLGSFAGPVDVTFQYSDGLNTPFPSDLRSWTGEPVWRQQMLLYRFDPTQRAWAVLAPVSFPPERVLIAPLLDPLIPGAGVGLYTAVGDPTLEAYTQFTTAEGWTSGNAAPQLPAAVTSQSDGLLKITADGPEGYAWWGVPFGYYPARRDTLFVGSFEVHTDTLPSEMPGILTRINSSDGQRVSAYAIYGIGTGQAAPSPGVPKQYHVFLQPSGHCIESAHNGDLRFGSLTPYFEMLSFLPDTDPSGMIGLGSFRFRPVDPASLAPWTPEQTYDFAGTGSALGWRLFGEGQVFINYQLFPTAQGLVFQGGALNKFAGIGALSSVTLQPGRLYRVRCRVKSDAEPHVCPSFRLRVGDDKFEVSNMVVIASVDGGEESPSFNAREYDLYFYPPQEIAAPGTARLSLAFDYMNYGAADRFSTAFTLEQVSIDSTSWVP